MPDVLRAYPWPDMYSVRVLKNPVTDRWHDDPAGLRAAAAEEGPRWAAGWADGDPERSNTFVGEGVGLIGAIRPAAEVLAAMVADAEALLAGGWRRS